MYDWHELTYADTCPCGTEARFSFEGEPRCPACMFAAFRMVLSPDPTLPPLTPPCALESPDADGEYGCETLSMKWGVDDAGRPVWLCPEHFAAADEQGIEGATRTHDRVA